MSGAVPSQIRSITARALVFSAVARAMISAMDCSTGQVGRRVSQLSRKASERERVKESGVGEDQCGVRTYLVRVNGKKV